VFVCLPFIIYKLTVTKCRVFLCVQLYVHARMQGKWTRLVRPTIQFFLISFSLYVGYTRVSDNKHHWSDVLVGLLQGALIAVLTVSFCLWPGVIMWSQEKKPKIIDLKATKCQSSCVGLFFFGGEVGVASLLRIWRPVINPELCRPTLTMHLHHFVQNLQVLREEITYNSRYSW